MAYYQIQYNTGDIYKGKSVTESAGNNLQQAKKKAKDRAKELNRGVRIFKDLGFVDSDGGWHSETL